MSEDLAALQAQLANAQADRLEALEQAHNSDEQVEGFRLELKRVGAELQERTEQLQRARKDTEALLEQNTRLARETGRVAGLLDGAGVDARAGGAPDGRPLQLDERLELLLQKLAHLGSVVDELEEERHAAAVGEAYAKDLADRLEVTLCSLAATSKAPRG